MYTGTGGKQASDLTYIAPPTQRDARGGPRREPPSFRFDSTTVSERRAKRRFSSAAFGAVAKRRRGPRTRLAAHAGCSRLPLLARHRDRAGAEPTARRPTPLPCRNREYGAAKTILGPTPFSRRRQIRPCTLPHGQGAFYGVDAASPELPVFPVSRSARAALGRRLGDSRGCPSRPSSEVSRPGRPCEPSSEAGGLAYEPRNVRGAHALSALP